MQRSSEGCSLAQRMQLSSDGCSVGSSVGRVQRRSVGSAYGRSDFESRLGTTGRFFPPERTSSEEMERGLDKWRWLNVCMNVIITV